MFMVFKAIGVNDIVVDGVHPALDTTIEQQEGYEALSNHALLVLLQIISKPILKKILKLSAPHEMEISQRNLLSRQCLFIGSP